MHKFNKEGTKQNSNEVQLKEVDNVSTWNVRKMGSFLGSGTCFLNKLG